VLIGLEVRQMTRLGGDGHGAALLQGIGQGSA
jgi:hypothetical protein